MTSEHAFIAHPIFKADSGKVEKILEGSLDSISSPSSSVKIQIMGGKVCLRCKGKTFCIQKFVDNIQKCFAFIPFLPII